MRAGACGARAIVILALAVLACARPLDRVRIQFSLLANHNLHEMKCCAILTALHNQPQFDTAGSNVTLGAATVEALLHRPPAAPPPPSPIRQKPATLAPGEQAVNEFPLSPGTLTSLHQCPPHATLLDRDALAVVLPQSSDL